MSTKPAAPIQETTALFDKWHKYAMRIATSINLNLFFNLTPHAQRRQHERNISTQQLTHILKNGFELLHIQKSSQPQIFKLRIIGKDFDKVDIIMVILIYEQMHAPFIQVKSMWYRDEERNKTGYGRP